MIKSQIVKLKIIRDNILIENRLKELLGSDPIRWAIVKVEGEDLYISVSC